MKFFRFEHPEYLWLTVLIPALYLLWIFLRNKDRATLRKLGDASLIDKLSERVSAGKKRLKFLSINLAILFIALALANPQLGSRMQKVERKGIELIIAIDISNSMLAEDIKPNRLTRAKMAINKLVDKLRGDKLGIIVFAGDAYTQLPITTDYAAARMFLSSVSTDYINNQGTSIASAIKLARQTFENSSTNTDKENNKALIIITDGEDHEEGALQEAQKARQEGIKVFTIGMGLAQGAPIPLYSGGRRIGFKKDRQGQTVITRINENLMKDMASRGGGIYVRASNSNTGLSRVFHEINKMNKEKIETKVFKEYEGWFQVFLLPAILLLMLEILLSERKGKIADKLNIFSTAKAQEK